MGKRAKYNKIKKATAVLLIFFTLCVVISAFSLAEDLSNVALELSVELEIVEIKTEQEEDLATGYIYQKMYPVKLRAPLPSGYRLEGTNRYLYGQLRTKIAKVAAGEVSEAIFTFPASSVYDKVNYTAADLGVEILVIGGEISPEAKAAISNIVRQSFDHETIISCLLADCPYEMYWYDKTVGCIVGFPTIYYDYENNTVSLVGNVTFSLAVSEEYRAKGVEPEEYIINGETVYRYCHVGTQWGQSVTTAVQNALAIVNRYEELDDYERLAAYKDDIRELTGYNYDAANGHDEHGNEILFGNPWQLVWVFDGDPETTVVCEGYSKAFQYLNDMSSSTVTVICVTGRMNNGAHMWNVVKMDDGQNYLADVTNCYTDENGHTYLFLDGYKESQGNGVYLFDDGPSDILYTYGERNEIHNPDDLIITDTGYLDTKTPAPIFAAGAGADTYRIGDELVFTLQGNQEAEYDSFVVRVTHVHDDSEITGKMKRQAFEGTTWSFGPTFHEAGSYRIQFAGKRGTVTSLWSDPFILTPAFTADLGRIRFTDATYEALQDIGAGDTESLEWGVEEKIQNSIDGYTIRLTDMSANAEVWFEQALGMDETETEILWAFCPGSYKLCLIPHVSAGYAYSCDDPVEVKLQNSGKIWLISEDGVLTKYFGSGRYVIVPEIVDDTEVVSIGPAAFHRSKANTVRVPSFIGVNVQAFSGDNRIDIIIGYEKSEAETVAKAAGIEFESLGIKPGVVKAIISSEKGYRGYTAVICLQEEADAVLIKETKSQVQCDGIYVSIPLDATGDYSYTLAAVKDGVRGDYGDTLSVCVEEVGNRTLEIPGNLQRIEDEAFQGVNASVVKIPDSVQFVGKKAFADIYGLQVVKIDDLQGLDVTAFENCGEFVYCFPDASVGFEAGVSFLVR